jgi:hypothetical protein
MLRCFLGLHKWGKWSEPMRGTWVHRDPFSGLELSRYEADAQTRACQDCGKQSNRKVK